MRPKLLNSTTSLSTMVKSSVGNLKNWGLDLNRHKIIVNSKQESSQAGIYAIGDCCYYDGKIRLDCDRTWRSTNRLSTMPSTTLTLSKKYNQNTLQVYKKKTTNHTIRGFIVFERFNAIFLLLYIVFIFSNGQLDYVLSCFLIAFYSLLKDCKVQ